jgi:hypothetical protein
MRVELKGEWVKERERKTEEREYIKGVMLETNRKREDRRVKRMKG